MPAQARLPGSLDLLPGELVELALASLSHSDLCALACTHPLFCLLAGSDRCWAQLFSVHFGGVARLLDAAAPSWWAGATWKARFAALCGGAPFQAQVYHREQDNAQEDFLLSCYDASVALSGRGPPPAGAAPLFDCEYLAMGGGMPPVRERGLPLARLRAAPSGSDAHAVFRGTGGAVASLAVGEEVEVQWKGRREHPFGWWLGTVASLDGGRLVLEFRQYPASSLWRSVKAPLTPGREALLNDDESFGYMGGLRRLSGEEVAEWRRHCGARALAAAPAAAEEGGDGEVEAPLDDAAAADDGAPVAADAAAGDDDDDDAGAIAAEGDAAPSIPAGPPVTAAYDLSLPGEQLPVPPAPHSDPNR